MTYSIGDVKCRCIYCEWAGTVYDCEPDVDGDGSLGCPKCLRPMRNIPGHKIDNELSCLADVSIGSILYRLNQAREIAKELKSIERIRRIIDNLNIAIDDLEKVESYLKNYPTMETKDDKVIPIG